jgi:hypothetical protein
LFQNGAALFEYSRSLQLLAFFCCSGVEVIVGAADGVFDVALLSETPNATRITATHARAQNLRTFIAYRVLGGRESATEHGSAFQSHVG